MKKQFFLLIAASLFSLSSLVAQDGRQRMTSEERVKITMEKLTVLNLSAEAKTSTEAIFRDFFDTQEKARKEMRESGNNDREGMLAKREQLMKERDDKLKKVFSVEQFKKWKEEIEPTLRPQRQAADRNR
jgi:hypothetical protein